MYQHKKIPLTVTAKQNSKNKENDNSEHLHVWISLSSWKRITNTCVPLLWSYLGLTDKNDINLVFIYNQERSPFKIYLFLSSTLSLYFLILFFCLLIGRFLLRPPFSYNRPVRKSTCTSDMDCHQANITIHPSATAESERSLPLFYCFSYICGS